MIVIATRTVAVTLTAQVSSYLAGMEQAARKTKETTRDAKEQFEAQAQAMEKLGGAAFKVGTVAAIGLGLTAKAAIDWQTAWTGVMKTVDGTPEQLAEIEDGLRNLASELPATHDEIAAVAEAAGQLGVQSGAIVEFTKVMIDLGETTNLSADEAATSIAQLMNVMQTAPDEVDNLGSALVALGNDGASTERDIVQMAQRIAGAGKIIGLTEGEVLGFANALASVGIDAEAGGSAISKIMTDIAKSVSTGGKTLQGFADVAGMSSDEFSKAFKEAPADAIATFIEGLGGINDKGGDVFSTLTALGQSDVRVTNALLGMANSGDLLRKSLDLGNDSWEENTALMTEAEKRYSTVEAQLGMTQGAINDAAISLGSVFLPAISDASEGIAGLAKGVADLPEPVLALGSGFGVITAAVGIFGGGLLLLTPRIAATKLAMIELELTGKNLAKTLGKGSLLAIGVAAVAGGLANMTAEGELTLEQISRLNAAFQTDDLKAFTAELRLGGLEGDNIKGALEALTGSDYISFTRDAAIATNNFMAGIPLLGEAFKGLAKDGNQNDAVFKQYGATLATTAATDLPAATAAFAAMQKEAGGTSEATKNLLEVMPGYKAALIDQAAAAGETLTEEELLAFAMGKGELATELAREANIRNSKSLTVMAGDADATSAAVAGLSDELRNFGKVTFDVIDAEQAFYAALDGVNDRLGEEGFKKGLDQSTESGRKNMDVLQEIAARTNDYAAATYDATGSIEEVNKILEAGQAELDKTAGKFGVAKGKVNEFAGAMIATPKQVAARVLVDTESAMKAIKAVKSAISTITGAIVTVTGEKRKATGGAIYGPGTGTSDEAGLYRLSNGEHVWTAAEVAAAGGQGAMYQMRQDVMSGQGFATGGAVSPMAAPIYANASGPVRTLVLNVNVPVSNSLIGNEAFLGQKITQYVQTAVNDGLVSKGWNQ